MNKNTLLFYFHWTNERIWPFSLGGYGPFFPLAKPSPSPKPIKDLRMLRRNSHSWILVWMKNKTRFTECLPIRAEIIAGMAGVFLLFLYEISPVLGGQLAPNYLSMETPRARRPKSPCEFFLHPLIPSLFQQVGLTQKLIAFINLSRPLKNISALKLWILSLIDPQFAVFGRESVLILVLNFQ